jgi:hypothetical protein
MMETGRGMFSIASKMKRGMGMVKRMFRPTMVLVVLVMLGLLPAMADAIAYRSARMKVKTRDGGLYTGDGYIFHYYSGTLKTNDMYGTLTGDFRGSRLDIPFNSIKMLLPDCPEGTEDCLATVVLNNRKRYRMDLWVRHHVQMEVDFGVITILAKNIKSIEILAWLEAQ